MHHSTFYEFIKCACLPFHAFPDRLGSNALKAGEIAHAPFARRDCRVVNLCSLYRGPCCQLMGIAPGVGESAQVNKALYAMGLKEADECLHGMGGMADGENKGGGFGQGTPFGILSWIMRERDFLPAGHETVLPPKEQTALRMRLRPKTTPS